MDEFIHCPKPCLLLSTTCDEILSWTIGIWTTNHLVSDSKCNIVNLQSPKLLQGMTNNVGSITLVVLQLVSSKTIRIGETKYHIQCRCLIVPLVTTYRCWGTCTCINVQGFYRPFDQRCTRLVLGCCQLLQYFFHWTCLLQ